MIAKWIVHFFISVFGIILSIVYINFALSNDAFYISYFIFGIFCVLQVLLNIISGFLVLKNIKTKIYTIMVILSILTSVPVIFTVFIWLAHFCGLDFLPPPQR